MIKVGDTIKITNIDDAPYYNGRVGVVKRISTDPWGDIVFDGTWGSVGVYLNVDTIVKVDDE